MTERDREDADLPEDLRGLAESAKRVDSWATPPDDVLEAAISGAREDFAPAAGDEARDLDWAPADVRSEGAALEGEPRVLSRVTPTAEVGLVAVPPKGDGRWKIQGKIWLREPTGKRIEILLLHEDHVVASTSIESGGDFELDEFIADGWVLEIHLPDGETLTLTDPGP